MAELPADPEQDNPGGASTTDYEQLWKDAHPKAGDPPATVGDPEKAYHVAHAEKAHVEDNMELDAIIKRNEADLAAKLAASGEKRGPQGYTDPTLEQLDRKIAALYEAKSATRKANSAAAYGTASDYDAFKEAERRFKRFDPPAS